MRLSKIFFLAVTVSASNIAHATSCQELAVAFAKDTASMSDIELGRLRTCVTDVLRKKLIDPGHVPSPAPKASPPVPALAPAPRPALDK